MKKSSKNLLKNCVVVSIMAFCLFAPQYAHAFSAAVQQIQGDVLVHKTGTDPDAWEAIKEDTVLASGDSIKTRTGSCVLTYSDQATFAMENNTSLTVEEKPNSQDLKLAIGKIRGKVNKPKVTKPFQVVTPAAVAAVRGTEVDFSFNDQGQLAVDLHNGTIQVLNDQAQLDLTLDGNKHIKVKYDKEANTISILNECGSDGAVGFKVLGTQYNAGPCEEKNVELKTATGPNGPPDTNTNDPGKEDDPNDGRQPLSPSGQ